MFNLIKRIIKKKKSRQLTNEYGYTVKSFNLSQDGKIDYAQWMHPSEKPKTISQSMVNFYKKYTRIGSMTIDIGAHTGDTSIPMALATGKNSILLALEPNPYVFKILKKNAALNPDKTNIIPLNFAATDSDGEFDFNYSDASFCNGGFFKKIKNKKHRHKFSLKVKGKNLEKFLKEEYGSVIKTISLIKVDAEGYDKEILKNLKPILIQYKPNIISECNKFLTSEERSELFELLNTSDYTLYKIDGFEEDHKKVLINNPADMSRWKHFDILAVTK